PMPPVRGPLSPSPARLKSRAGARASARLPSLIAISESSRPSSSSSTTMVCPARPKLCSTSIASIALRACSRSRQTSTPLPSASPSALTTTRPSRSSAHFCAAGASLKTPKSAVGMPALRIMSLAKALLLSIRPAARSGPKVGMPSARMASPTPAATADSGPRITSPIFSCLANLTRLTTSSAGIRMFLARPPVPPFPGAMKTRELIADCMHFQARACSRAPDPTTRIRTARGYLRSGDLTGGRRSAGGPVWARFQQLAVVLGEDRRKARGVTLPGGRQLDDHVHASGVAGHDHHRRRHISYGAEAMRDAGRDQHAGTSTACLIAIAQAVLNLATGDVEGLVHASVEVEERHPCPWRQRRAEEPEAEPRGYVALHLASVPEGEIESLALAFPDDAALPAAHHSSASNHHSAA